MIVAIALITGILGGMCIYEYSIRRCARLGVRMHIGAQSFSVVEVKNAKR